MQPAEDQRFYRGSDRFLGGVCSGLAEGFHVDPLWVRLAFVALAFLQGVGVLLYLVLWLLMPERVEGHPAGTSGLNSMSADLKRAWAELRAQFGGARPTASPTAPPTTAAPATSPPSEPAVTTPPESPAPPPPGTAATTLPPAPVTTKSYNQPLLLGLVLVVIGLAFLANNVGFADWGVVWPAGLVAVGIFLLVRAAERRP